MKEMLLEIGTSVRRNKLRTFLTGFSVAWGILMLSILLGSGNGLKNGVQSNLGNYTINSAQIGGGYTSLPYMGFEKWRHIRLTNNDLEILKNEFPEVRQVAAQAWFRQKEASNGERFKTVTLFGAHPHTPSITGLEILEGRYINEPDMKLKRKVAVIDQETARLLLGDGDPLGKTILVEDAAFTVVGIYHTEQMSREATCHIPLSTGQLIYNAGEPTINQATFTLEGIGSIEQMEEFKQRVRRRFAREHRFSPDDQSAIWFGSTLEFSLVFSKVSTGINLFIWLISLGTLLAGVVGVSNIMLVTVSERTAEFGIRKALGAPPASIIRLILTESVAITAFFGYFGMVLGVAIMEGVDHYLRHADASDQSSELSSISFFRNPTLDLSAAVSATLVLIVAGLIAGYVPARRAARLKTIDALRHNK